MDDQVAEIKRKLNIVDVVAAYVPLKKMGRHHKGLCPFHGEKTPSFMVNEELGLYKCFGCGAGGDVIKFLMEIEGLEFREALERLAEKAGVKLVNYKNERRSDRDEMYEVLDLAAKYFHWILVESEAGDRARKYLEQRKVNSKLWETFQIGYALPGWDNLTNYLTKKKGYKIGLLEKAGLVSSKESGGVYDKFRGRIMFPLQDAAGKIVGFSGRILPEIAKENDAKYMNSPETELYHKGRMLFGFYQAKKAIREKKRVVLVEGHMDMISSFGAGVTETVAVGGTALTEEQVEMVARLADKIYFSLDADDAGNAAMKRSVELAEKRGMGIKVVHIEGGKDPDEIARNSPRLWTEMVDSALEVYDHVMKRAFDKYDKESIDGVKKIIGEVVPFLAKIENSVVREVWAKRFAEKLGVDIKAVVTEIEKTRNGKSVEVVKTVSDESKSGDTKIERLLKRLIVMLINYEKEAKPKIRQWIAGEKMPGAAGKALVWMMENMGDKDPAMLLEEVPGELKEVVGAAYMEDGGEQENLEILLAQLIRELIKERKKQLMEEMSKARGEKDEEKESKMFEELNELNKKESKVMAVLG